jgi:hypothetical protein
MERGRFKRRPGRLQSLRLLLGLADLDGLAALVVLLREACEANDRQRAFEIGESLYGALLIATLRSPLNALWLEVALFCSQTVFPLASDGHRNIEFDVAEFGEQRQYILRAFLRLEDAGELPFERHSTRAFRSILLGKYGEDLRLGLAPRIKLSRSPEETVEATLKDVAERRIGREWGLSVLREGGYARHPPDEVVKAMVAARWGQKTNG